jgi:8-oxo-dGTP pyrophosphatase MutT (NUDIX family)
MTEVPAPLHPRDSGDAWVEGPDGRRYWGRYGAAGLLVHDHESGVLLQHRAEWSHFGGTWGLPGGARHEGESAVAGAVREAGEEAGVPAGALEMAFSSTFDLGFWSYVTVVARAARAFDAHIGDAESLELRWVPVSQVDSLPLHPGFGSSWPALRERLGERIRLVVDGANVVGSRPDGWWRDRLGAAERLIGRLKALSAAGIDSSEFGGPAGRVWPRIDVVVEGTATDARGRDRGHDTLDVDGVRVPPVRVVSAPASGDDTIVVTAAEQTGAERVVVITADRELSRRVGLVGADVRGPGWLLALLDDLG